MYREKWPTCHSRKPRNKEESMFNLPADLLPDMNTPRAILDKTNIENMSAHCPTGRRLLAQ